MKYATGPRNDNYGFSEGVIPLEVARQYDGEDASDGDVWARLGEEDWDFDLDESELEEAGQLASLYVDGDRFGLDGRGAIAKPRG